MSDGLTRRGFLQLIASAGVAAVAVPKFAFERALWLTPQPGVDAGPVNDETVTQYLARVIAEDLGARYQAQGIQAVHVPCEQRLGDALSPMFFANNAARPIVLDCLVGVSFPGVDIKTRADVDRIRASAAASFAYFLTEKRYAQVFADLPFAPVGVIEEQCRFTHRPSGVSVRAIRAFDISRSDYLIRVDTLAGETAEGRRLGERRRQGRLAAMIKQRLQRYAAGDRVSYGPSA